MNDRLAVGESHTFVVLGTPATGGSKSIVPSPNSPTGFAVRPSSKRTKPWMRLVEAVVRGDWGDYPPLDCPFEVEVVFYFKKPRGYGDDDWPLRTGGDLDKLLRATLDPLAGSKEWPGAISNDRRIVRITAERRFGEPERAEITIVRLDVVRESAQVLLAV